MASIVDSCDDDKSCNYLKISRKQIFFVNKKKVLLIHLLMIAPLVNKRQEENFIELASIDQKKLFVWIVKILEWSAQEFIIQCGKWYNIK